MNDIDTRRIGDSMHRLAKLALDSGEAGSVEEALTLFSSYALHLEVGQGLADSPSRQAALLTAANAARRSFLGGVTFSGAEGVRCCLAGSPGADLGVMLKALGVRSAEARPDTPVVYFGDGQPRSGPALQTIMSGWAGGCIPAGADAPADDPGAFVLAGVVAGAFAVCEAFQQVRGSNPAAGRRSVGLSLWDFGADWTDGTARGRTPDLLPSSAWLIGLGNLGQAFLWSLGLLPYAKPDAVSLTLQDFDSVAISNDSTSLLTSLDQVGRPKTREMAAWAEARGFRTRISERRFDENFRISAEDPPVAICGVDNALARAALEDAGFECVLEAGLGNGLSDFLAIRLHSFPQRRRARDIWSEIHIGDHNLLDQPAYQDLAARGADRCGLVELAGRTVGAPFVGAIAGAMTIAELVRLANSGPITAVVDLHLRAPRQRTVVLQPDGYGCNPGITEAICSRAT